MSWKERIQVGGRFSVTKTISESDVYLYAGITGDFHPNHVNEQYASTKMFKHRVVHGALLIGFMSAATTQLRDVLEPPGYMAQEYQAKFVAPVYFGDTVTVTLTVAEILAERRKVIMKAEITNQDGTTVAQGSATVKVLRGEEE
ncbi:MAG: MaoC family dehydratase [Clostridia bacterium]|nr:MaoC family dehydratase [Clostridia bacterium]